MPTLNFQDLEKSACSRYSESNKACKDPKSYWTISLLSVPNKILDRLIYVYVDSINNSLLPKEQAGFRSQKSTVYQVVLLTYNIEDSFRTKEKTGAVFFNLTVAYDTVWFRGLTCKLLKFLLNKHMVRIMELVRNRSLSVAWQQANQAAPYEIRRSSGIGLGSPPIQYLYVRSTFLDFQKLCLCRQSSIVALFWKLERFLRGDFKLIHDCIFIVSPDLGVEAQSH